MGLPLHLQLLEEQVYTWNVVDTHLVCVANKDWIQILAWNEIGKKIRNLPEGQEMLIVPSAYLPHSSSVTEINNPTFGLLLTHVTISVPRFFSEFTHPLQGNDSEPEHGIC